MSSNRDHPAIVLTIRRSSLDDHPESLHNATTLWRNSWLVEVRSIFLGHVEHPIDQSGQSLALLGDDVKEFAVLLRLHISRLANSISEKARIEVSRVGYS